MHALHYPAHLPQRSLVFVKEQIASLAVTPFVGRPDDFVRDLIASRLPFLITRGFLGVGSQPVGFDALDRQSRDVLERQMEHRMLGDRGVSITAAPFLMEVSRLLSRQLFGDLAKRMR